MNFKYPLLNLINLPAQTVGNMSIVQDPYPPGREFTVVSVRTAFMTGQKRAKTVSKTPGVIHKLMEKEMGTWMSDLPCEIYQHAEFVPNLIGRVLVGGLGLGLILKMMEMNPMVTSAVVVEKNKDVIELIQPHLSVRYPIEVVNQDLFQYLRDCKKNGQLFNSAYYDIWTSDSGGNWYEYIEPLRKLSKGIIPQKGVHCWQEDVISAQRWK
ncbi:MAG: hypothetical protein HQ579_02790 [Candidatus Omnitrophica bacterium]|nr:hypothetical protein [Candidatus Omnitrophota bacterium]